MMTLIIIKHFFKIKQKKQFLFLRIQRFYSYKNVEKLKIINIFL